MDSLLIYGLLAALAKGQHGSGDTIHLDRTATHGLLRHALGDVGRNSFYSELTHLAALADDLVEDAHALACDAARESGEDMPARVAPALSVQPYRGRGGNRLALVMSTEASAWDAMGNSLLQTLSRSRGVVTAIRVARVKATMAQVKDALQDLDISPEILTPTIVSASSIRLPARTAESACDAYPTATCTACGETKSRDDFIERLAKVNGLDSLCRVCRRVLVYRSRATPSTPEAVARAAVVADRVASRRRGEAKANARVLVAITNTEGGLYLGGIMAALPRHYTLARVKPILLELQVQGLITITKPSDGLTSYALAIA